VVILPRGWRHLVPRLPICVSGPNRILATMKLCEWICGIIRGMKMIAVTCALACAMAFGAVMAQQPELVVNFMQRLSEVATPWIVGSAVAMFALWVILLCLQNGILARQMEKFNGLAPLKKFFLVAAILLCTMFGGSKERGHGTDATSLQGGAETWVEVSGGLRSMPPEVAVLSNALAIMAFDIDASNREVAFELSWVSNLFDYTDSRNLFLFSSTNLLERKWTPLGALLMPSGANSCAFTISTNDVDSVALPWFLDSFSGIGFYRFAADLDSDGDGLIDSCETLWTLTDPDNPDTDGDGLTDGQELSAEIGTNPLLYDTDGDGVSDGDEIVAGTDPCSSDSDGDGLSDREELGGWEYSDSGLPVFDVSGGTNLLVSSKSYTSSVFAVPLPFDVMCAGLLHTNLTIGINGLVGLISTRSSQAFSAGDLNHNLSIQSLSQYHTAVAAYWDDLYAAKNGGSQITVADIMTNGQRYCVIEYSCIQQYSLRTNTLERGTFQIVIPQAETNEIYVHYIDMSPAFNGLSASIGAQLPNRHRNFAVACNNAGSVTNGMVLIYRFGTGTNPLEPDSDGDGLNDSDELLVGTCPWIPDTDDDGLKDGWEVFYGIDPCSASGDDGADGDPDGDSLRNLKEQEYETNPILPDTDGDGLSDAEETGSISACSGLPWLQFDMSTNLTQALMDSNNRCVTYTLPFRMRVQGATVTNVTLSYNGLLMLDRAGSANDGMSNSYISFTSALRRSSLLLAPYLAYFRFYTNFTERVSSVRLGTATHDGEGYLLVEWKYMYNYRSSTSTNSISFQMAIPTNHADRAYAAYGDIIGRDMTGKIASIGMQTMYGGYLHSYCDHGEGKVWEGLGLNFLFGANTNPLNPDSDGDGIMDGLEFSIGTDPIQPDTDGDGMDDGWELTYGFDPVTHNSETPRTDDDGTADPDGDGLTNAEECEWGTNPSGADEDGDGQPDGYDTDGDGAGDGTEVSQRSDPSDATDLGAPNSRVPVSFYFGDPSDSCSEKYKLELVPVAGPGGTPTGFSWVNAEYGECETKEAMLKEGWKYAITFRHSSTDPKYVGPPRPDYDYSLQLVASNLPPNVVLSDPSGLFGGNGNSGASFTGEGKVAYIHVLSPPEISAPETIGVNQDDDNGNGTPDCEDIGEVAGDDDLVEMKVRVRCPAGLSGTVTVDVYGYLLNGRMWRDRARTQRVETQDTFTVNGDTERSYYVEGETFSVGHLTESFRVRFQCLGKTLASEHRFTFVYRIAEPITTERVGGNLVNPCCAIVGANTPMRINVRPQGFPDSKIKWSVVSGTGTFAGADTGRDVSFVAGGSDGDSVTLKVEVGDCPGAPPQFTLRTTAMHEVKIYPCAISDEENPSQITDAHVVSLLDGVNAIFRQVGLHFSLGAPVMNVTNNVWAKYGLVDMAARSEIRGIMSNTDGLELYFVEGVGDGTEPHGAYNYRGIIVRNSADSIVLAHEFGHACGWVDIFAERDRMVPDLFMSNVKAAWLPDDWNNGTGCRFYDMTLLQEGAIRRLLMHGEKNASQCDMPGGGVFGLPKSGSADILNVGRAGMLTLQPQSQ